VEKRGRTDASCIQRGRDYTTLCPQKWVRFSISESCSRGCGGAGWLTSLATGHSSGFAVCVCAVGVQVEEWKEHSDAGKGMSVGKAFAGAGSE
jgi:hypothetical protein